MTVHDINSCAINCKLPLAYSAQQLSVRVVDVNKEVLHIFSPLKGSLTVDVHHLSETEVNYIDG